MDAINSLFQLAGGHALPEDQDGPARRMQLVAVGALATALMAAIFGIAAGSTDWSLALGNTYKLPMAILLSALSGVPIGLLCWKLTGLKARGSDLLLGIVTGNFTAATVLAAMSPVVALFYHTSSYLGGVIAMGTAGVALLIGIGVMIRWVMRRVPKGHRRATLIPLLVMLSVQMMALAQLIYLASGFLPEVTVFDMGADGLLGQ